MALGSYRFNWSIGESGQLESEKWLEATELLEVQQTPAALCRPGDIYARLL
jgi:hypothetical protein